MCVIIKYLYTHTYTYRCRDYIKLSLQKESTSLVNNPYNQVKKTGTPSTFNNNNTNSTTSSSNHQLDEIDHEELESIISLINDHDHHLTDHYNPIENLKNHHQYYQQVLSSNCIPQLQRQKHEENHNIHHHQQQQPLYSPPRQYKYLERQLNEYKHCDVLDVQDEEERLLLHDLFFICN
ncbi:unnamed protein product [Trichobilharzia szidati]|nr:unnamed protein product [Trichobilharzia szidati]